MSQSGKPFEELIALVDTVIEGAGAPDGASARVDAIVLAEFAAQLATVEPGTLSVIGGPGERIARLAAYVDGGLEDKEWRQIASLPLDAPAELQDVIASLAYLDTVATHMSATPADLLETAITAGRSRSESVARSANIVPLQRPSARKVPLTDSFEFLAAASDTDHRAISCRSQSGLWTLEVFVRKSGQSREAERGSLLLTVHPEHRETYEGRTARVFVTIGNEERVLAEEPVRNGEVYAAISLVGLDLWTRDVINVIFGLSQEAS